MKKGMKTKIIRIFAVVLAMSLIVSILPVIKIEAKPDDFDAEVQIGFGNEAEIGKYVPFYITVENKSKDFNGYVQMIIPVDGSDNYMYEQNVSIPAGSKKTVSFVLPVYSNYGRMNIRLATEKGKVLWSKEKRYTVQTNITNVNVGIFSNDYSALGYMDRQPFQGDKQFITKIFELNENSFGADWHALDMLDVIVISDYSTDLFTDAQLRSLTMWVNNGGLLIVGTGSTSSKTLSGLNNKLFEVTPGKLETKETKLGLTLKTYQYDYVNNYYSDPVDKDPYSNPEFVEAFEDDFEDYKDFYESEYREDFENDWYGGPLDDDVWADEWIQDDFKRYCLQRIYEDYVNNMNGSGYSSLTYEIQDGPSISAGVLQMTSDKEDYAEVGEDLYGGVYDLHHIFTIGKGYIVVSGVDFTKNPIPGYEYASTFFVDLVESLIGKKISEEYNNSQYSHGYGGYGQGLDWKEKSYLSNVADAPIPPSLFYMGLLILFQGLFIALYFIMRHKQKSFRLWFWYPMIAIGACLLIYCLGFSTRLMRPRLKVDSVITLGDHIATENSYAAFSVPRNKSYRLSVSSRYQVRQDMSNYYSYYNGSSINDIDMDKYSKSYNVSSNSCDLIINDIESLGTEKMVLETLDYTDKDIIINMDIDEFTNELSPEGVSITNKMGYDLENVLVMVNNNNIRFYALGKIKQGETVKLSDNIKVSRDMSYMNNSDAVDTDLSSTPMILGLLFGSLSPSYRTYRNRSRILHYALDRTTSYGISSQITVFAFPKKDSKDRIQESTKYREERTEIIIKNKVNEPFNFKF